MYEASQIILFFLYFRSALHDVTHRGDEVDTKLRQVSTDLSQFISAHVQQNLDLMLKTTDKQVIVDIYSNNEYVIVNIYFLPSKLSWS